MPLFEFDCANCKKRHEQLVFSSDKELGGCPHCGSAALTKVFSQTAPPVFRGSGFYSVDYKKKKINPSDVE